MSVNMLDECDVVSDSRERAGRFQLAPAPYAREAAWAGSRAELAAVRKLSLCPLEPIEEAAQALPGQAVGETQLALTYDRGEIEGAVEAEQADEGALLEVAQRLVELLLQRDRLGRAAELEHEDRVEPIADGEREGRGARTAPAEARGLEAIVEQGPRDRGPEERRPAAARARRARQRLAQRAIALGGAKALGVAAHDVEHAADLDGRAERDQAAAQAQDRLGLGLEEEAPAELALARLAVEQAGELRIVEIGLHDERRARLTVDARGADDDGVEIVGPARADALE